MKGQKLLFFSIAAYYNIKGTGKKERARLFPSPKVQASPTPMVQASPTPKVQASPITEGAGFADTEGEKVGCEGACEAKTNRQSFDDELVSIRQLTFGFGKADWMEGACEARRIVDPSTMGSSLSDISPSVMDGGARLFPYTYWLWRSVRHRLRQSLHLW